MKTPSYQIIGIGIGIAAVCAWMFLVEKEVEKYKGYYNSAISRGPFLTSDVECLYGAVCP